MDLENLRFALRDKIDDWGLKLSRAQLLVVGLLAILLIGGVAYTRFRSQPSRVTVIEGSSPRQASKNFSGKTATALPKTSPKAAKEDVQQRLVVHVAGAVAAPGVYSLAKGSRVNDAVAAAGSALPEANVNAVNLAAKLLDGQKVYLPVKGEPAPPAQENPVGGGTVGGNPAGEAPSSGPINLNAATVEQLDSLPGVGPVLAKRIADYRTEHGGFKSIDGLKEVEGIGDHKFEQMKNKVTVE